MTDEGRAIDAQLKTDEKAAKAALKVLVLGTSASGKSTVAKQMKILHCEGFSSDELVNYKQILILNIFNGMKELVFQAEQFGIKILRKNKKVATHFANANPYTETLNSDTVELAKQLWADKGTHSIRLYSMRTSDADVAPLGVRNDAITPRASLLEPTLEPSVCGCSYTFPCLSLRNSLNLGLTLLSSPHPQASNACGSDATKSTSLPTSST